MAKPRTPTSAIFPGIGPVTERRLIEIGVKDRAALKKLGAVKAYRRLRFRYGKDVTLNALYGLEAVILGCDWRQLPDSRKTELKRAVEQEKGPSPPTDPRISRRSED
ncbi:MAG TPA: TfoX/Sxy family protein [Candidatus Cybelea sp.]|nr:TfoX/Sxy family protein [Candidatus Cybelea sp.]